VRALLTAAGLGWQREDGTFVIAEADLTLLAGTLSVVHGPARSGKTTLVQLLAKWLPVTTGVVTFSIDTGTAATIAVVPQALALLDELTVRENITFVDRIQHRQQRLSDDALAGVERLGLRHLLDRSVEEVSVGERQRVMIARALAGRPQVLLADEPTAHQDAANAANIFRLLRDAVDYGAAVLVVTREAEAGIPTDRHFWLRDQRLVASLAGSESPTTIPARSPDQRCDRT
jgi:putative ABC transport system ATP-binding protein